MRSFAIGAHCFLVEIRYAQVKQIQHGFAPDDLFERSLNCGLLSYRPQDCGSLG